MKEPYNIISIDGHKSVIIGTSDEVRKERDSLLAVTSTVLTVNNQDQATRAAIVMKDVKALTRSVEIARQAAKEPVLEQGKRIDALAKELTGKLELESDRISRVLGVWQQEQSRIAEEARQKAWEDEERIRAKARADLAELERKQQVARTAEKAKEYAAQAHAVDLKAENAIVSTRVTAAAAMPSKVAGMATSNPVQFEVTDIQALYDAAPYLVTLTPNTAAIKSALKNLQAGQTLPGVRHWREARALVRG